MSVGMQNIITNNSNEKQYSPSCSEFQTKDLWDRLEKEVKENSRKKYNPNRILKVINKSQSSTVCSLLQKDHREFP